MMSAQQRTIRDPQNHSVEQNPILSGNVYEDAMPYALECNFSILVRLNLDMRHIQYQGETLPLPPGISVSPGIR